MIRFLDTRGIGEATYDPGEDLAWCAGQAHLLLVVLRVLDMNQAEVVAAVKAIHAQHPDWPSWWCKLPARGVCHARQSTFCLILSTNTVPRRGNPMPGSGITASARLVQIAQYILFSRFYLSEIATIRSTTVCVWEIIETALPEGVIGLLRLGTA
jgi:hypothetical protein